MKCFLLPLDGQTIISKITLDLITCHIIMTYSFLCDLYLHFILMMNLMIYFSLFGLNLGFKAKPWHDGRVTLVGRVY